MIELVGNMHMHTPYSDGEKYHHDIAKDAIAASLDFIVVTDHNIWVDGVEQVVNSPEGQVLMLVGEEVHDNQRVPQANHLLCYGAETELSPFAKNPQTLIDEVKKQGGVCFLAHPDDYNMPLFGGIPDLGWHNWEVEGHAGFEIWNYMTSFVNEISRLVGTHAKDNLFNKVRALPIALNPERFITAPEQATLDRWDRFLAQGKRLSAIGNSDAHGTPVQLGPIAREMFPYDFLFRAVNTHILVEDGLLGDVSADKKTIYRALEKGTGWVGYDMAHPTNGFVFDIIGTHTGSMGDDVKLAPDSKVHIEAPAECDIRLVRHGHTVRSVSNARAMTVTISEPGAYRVECKISYQNKKRGWIYSNPIYLV